MSGSLWSESFGAMGTTCSVSVVARVSELRSAHSALAAARREIDTCERALSRFDPASDLSRLNRAAGQWTPADVRLVEALDAALRAREDTDGLFDPTVLPALAAAGYDRSFEQLRARPPRALSGFRPGARIDLDAGRARVEAGAAVDLGGIGKGFAATRAVSAMRAAWPAMPGALVDLGGDLALDGSPPEGGRWRIAVADPRSRTGTLGVLRLAGGGVATSGRDRRRFGVNGDLHHLIDPATGAPAIEGPRAVTVVAAEAATAEAFATAVAILPIEAAATFVAARPWLAALVVPNDAEPVVLGGLPLDVAQSRKELAA
jgi:thiamine biosynthesis lipoprotein